MEWNGIEGKGSYRFAQKLKGRYMPHGIIRPFNLSPASPKGRSPFHPDGILSPWGQLRNRSNWGAKRRRE